jgi:hypothetical protein
MPQCVKVGDLVKFNPSGVGPSSFRYVSQGELEPLGVVIEDCSPQRPENVNRYVEVLWADGDICKAHSTDLDILHEGG